MKERINRPKTCVYRVIKPRIISCLVTDSFSWCRRLILFGLLCLFSFSGPQAHLWQVSNLGLEPCLYLFYSSLLSHLVLIILFRICLASNCYLLLKVMLWHFVSCFVFRIYSCQMSFNCVSYLILSYLFSSRLNTCLYYFCSSIHLFVLKVSYCF